MTTENTSKRQIHSSSLGKRMLQGAVIALVLISVFIFSAGEPDPEWSKYWMVRPLILVPIAGAMGGIFYYIMDHLRYQGGWKTLVAIIISVLGYIVALWLGTVLGLDGTMWD